MPLVVPNIMNPKEDSKTAEWQNKLVGKKLSDGISDSTVSATLSYDYNSMMLTHDRILQGQSCQKRLV